MLEMIEKRFNDILKSIGHDSIQKKYKINHLFFCLIIHFSSSFSATKLKKMNVS